jgi:hypothetical protein
MLTLSQTAWPVRNANVAFSFTASRFNDNIPPCANCVSLGGIPQSTWVLTTEQPQRQTVHWGRLKIEMVGKHKTRPELLRVLALTLAVLFAVFCVQTLSHSHANGQDEAACQICQAAHIGPAPVSVTPLLLSPFVTTGFVQPFVVTFHQKFFFHECHSRAPPSA